MSEIEKKQQTQREICPECKGAQFFDTIAYENSKKPVIRVKTCGICGGHPYLYPAKLLYYLDSLREKLKEKGLYNGLIEDLAFAVEDYNLKNKTFFNPGDAAEAYIRQTIYNRHLTKNDYAFSDFSSKRDKEFKENADFIREHIYYKEEKL